MWITCLSYVPMARGEDPVLWTRCSTNYFIGREDQSSVQEAVMIRRINQQLRVNWLMFPTGGPGPGGEPAPAPVPAELLGDWSPRYPACCCSALGTPHLGYGTLFWKDMARDHPRHYQLLSSRFFGRVSVPAQPWPGTLPCWCMGSAKRCLGLTERSREETIDALL